jgi:PAS domain S-box-containing protein
LQVHQIELEMQNAELLEARDRVEELLEKYTDLYDFAPVGYYSLDEQGRIVEVNLTGAAMLGVERSRLINRRLQQFVVPASRPSFLGFLKQGFAGDGQPVCEAGLRNEAGAAFWAYLQAEWEASSAGTRKWCRLAVSNITARKQAEEAQRRTDVLTATNRELRQEIVKRQMEEEALRQSEDRFLQVAEIAGEFIWEVDAKGLYTYASPSVKQALEYTPEELVGKKHFYDLFVPSVREELKAAAFLAFTNRQSFRGFSNPNQSKSGEIVHLETSGSSMLDPFGNLIGYRGVDTNVTERRRMEEALRNSEEKFRQFFKNTPDYCYIVSREGNILDVNEAALKILGYERKELIGKPLARIYAPESLARMKELFVHWKETGQIRDAELVIMTRKGEKRIVILNVGAVTDHDGTILHSTSVQTDITERKKAERELEQQRAELAHLSRVTLLGELAGSLAHELNQPLTAILSNAQAAQHFIAHDQADLNEIRDILADIVAQDKRAGEVIRRLRLLLKKGEVQLQPLDINEVVEDVLKLVRSDLVNQGVIAQTELAPDPPVLHGDRVQLQQVLLNLVMNACDAMADVAPHVRRLTIRANPAGDGSVHLSVADCGTGISPEQLERIFEPFYTTKPQGLGLGLVVCRTIIAAYGGKLWAASNPEGALRFILCCR